jgi:hypothetical protein
MMVTNAESSVHLSGVLIMIVRTSFLPATALLGSALVLTACGGSDSTMGQAAATPASTSTMSASSINSTNMKGIAANALHASGGLNQQSNTATGSGTSPATNLAGPGMAVASANQLQTAQTAQAVSQLPTVTLNCNQGGTATLQLNTASRSRIASGDSVSLSANNCVQDADRVNGAVAVNVANLTGTPSSTSVWSAALGITFTNFTFDDGRGFDGLNGDISLSFNQTAPRIANFGLTSNSLKLVDTRPGSTVERTLTAFSTTGSVNSNVFTYRTSFTLAGENIPALGSGTFNVNTTKDFVQQRGSAPSEGVLVVKASDNTSLTLTTVDSSTVNIAADTTGDGVVDSTFATTWTELASLL